MRVTVQERNEALDNLRRFVKPGTTINTILRHVSRSGMQREISMYAAWTDEDGETRMQWLDGWASKVIGYRIGKREGLVVGGAGMDMGFHLVYGLSRALWPDGFGCIGKGCPSNDHTNGDRNYTPHEAHAAACEWLDGAPCVCTRVQHWHRDGGYALRHRWL
jgi:hypothetical protein